MTTLPVSQSYALLYLRRGGPDSLYNKLTDAMSAMGISFAASDFDQLREQNYVRKDGRGHHYLTPAGLWKVQMLARELAPQYQIHHVTFREPGRGSTLGPSASCSCMGWSIIASKRNENSIHRYAQQHLAQVAAGSWKRPRSVDAVFAEYLGKQNSGLAGGGPDPGAVVASVPPAAAPGIFAFNQGDLPVNKHFDLLGYKVRDIVSGYEGIVESVSFDLYGCVQAALRPEISKKAKPGDFPEGRWFDAKRLKVIGKAPVMEAPNFNEPEIGGIDKPMRSSSLPAR